MKKVYIISIRYSLISPEYSGSFLQNKEVGYESYKKMLLDSARLESRYSLFCNITLPSLRKAFERFQEIKSDYDEFKVILNASDLISDFHKDKLHELARANQFLEIVFSSEADANIRHVTLSKMRMIHGGEETLFCTMRMDDDDAISDQFMDKLTKYMRKELSGFAISFPNGYIGYFDSDLSLLGFRNYNKPKIAIGLGLICHVGPRGGKAFKSIYCLGAHGRIDQRVPTILDSSFKGYVRTAHMHSDVYSDAERLQREVEVISPDISIAEIMNEFASFL